MSNQAGEAPFDMSTFEQQLRPTAEGFGLGGILTDDQVNTPPGEQMGVVSELEAWVYRTYGGQGPDEYEWSQHRDEHMTPLLGKFVGDSTAELHRATVAVISRMMGQVAAGEALRLLAEHGSQLLGDREGVPLTDEQQALLDRYEDWRHRIEESVNAPIPTSADTIETRKQTPYHGGETELLTYSVSDDHTITRHAVTLQHDDLRATGGNPEALEAYTKRQEEAAEMDAMLGGNDASVTDSHELRGLLSSLESEIHTLTALQAMPNDQLEAKLLGMLPERPDSDFRGL